MRIDQNWFYRADIPNQAPVLFRLVEQSEASWIFLNADHDYPQRIAYELIDATHLNATISLADGSKPTNWEFTKIAD